MLLLSVKVKTHTVSALSVLCAVLLTGLCFFMLSLSEKDTVPIGGEPYPLKAEDEGDVARFLSACGYSVERCLSQREIVIPDEWNDSFTAYAKMQEEQGFDLSSVRGENATEYIYTLKDDERFAVVFVSDGRIRSAHLSRLNGKSAPEPIISE